MVDEEVKKYVEAEILPKYVGVGGHTSKHVLEVIKRSLGFFEQAKELNINMVYVIAAYHDLGRIVDDERHNIESAKMLRADEFIKRHFSADEIEVMAEAVEDHRASLGREPRSIYGKLVSSADRNTDINEMLERSYDYAKYLHPEKSEDEIIEDARYHLREKYSPDGYAAKTMYFENPDFKKMLVRMEEITRDFETFAKIMREHNEER